MLLMVACNPIGKTITAYLHERIFLYNVFCSAYHQDVSIDACFLIALFNAFKSFY